MKKWNLIFLFGVVFLFLIILIPYFQNAMVNASVVFLWARTTFTSVYMWIVFLGGILWVLTTLYLQSLINDVKRNKPEKFDLN